MEEFPNADGRMNPPPLLANATRVLRCLWNDNLSHFDTHGDLTAVPSGSQVHVWSAQEDEPRTFRNGPGGEVTAVCLSSTGR